MCSVSKPKPQTTTEKEPTIIRNLYLDGADPAMRANRAGRSALRITHGAITRDSFTPSVTPVTAPAVPAPAPSATARLSQLMGGKSGSGGVATAWKNIAALKKARRTNPSAKLSDIGG